MVAKQPLKSRPVCKLASLLPATLEADEVHLLADLNGRQGEPFKRRKDGTWKLTREVEPGREYQFRYHVILDGSSHYFNDAHADDYVPSGVGSENAVISC